ncbi:MAG: aconitate hydratase, partial [Coriobacteriales bacterium]|nr:aconitate hydratase [Coriobacteriales bacterium]
MTNVAGTNQTLAYKVLQDHLLAGKLAVGERITIRIDQTLTQDSTGTMVYLQLEAMDIGKVATDLSVAYIDHNTLQTGFENADDHAFIESVAARHNVIFSKPGGGICHQLHLENYGIPGKTLLGSDSHTPTGGGLGMLAIGAGGLDVAIAMAQGSYSLTVPKVIGVRLTGRLRPWVSAKDVILEVLRQLSVKGGVGAIIEYCGNGVATLSVTDRATITNMGAELGATTSIFPSDENTRIFLAQEGREEVWVPLTADADAVYDEMLEIDLSTLAPMAAKPHSPDNVEAISTIGPLKVDQVAIGSCTNASYSDLMKVAAILRGQRVHPKVSLVIAPGSAAILAELARNGALSDMIAAGARVIECACGPCIGMGQSPKSGAVSLRTFNRNFKGRSGTSDADVYLVSPETAAISAITGVLTEGLAEHGGLGIDLDLDKIPTLTADFASAYASFVEQPPALTDSDELPALVMGPNIKPFPRGRAVPTGSDIKGSVVLVAGDNITTDDIMPSDSRLLPYRSNIPHLAEYCFEKIDPEFPAKAKAAQGSNIAGAAIIGGDTYGQGSSREHAALVPLYLGIRMVLAKSFARIHRANLINNGILPLVFADPEDAEAIKAGDVLVFPDAHAQLGGASAGDAPAVAATGDAMGDVAAVAPAIAATGDAAAATFATSPDCLTVQNLTGS